MNDIAGRLFDFGAQELWTYVKYALECHGATC